MARTMSAEREALYRERPLNGSQHIFTELDAERAVSRKLAERLESALMQLPPEYCKTEGYVECRAALAQYTAQSPQGSADSEGGRERG